jgi:amino acid transporter
LLYFAAGNALFIGGSNGGALSATPAYFIAVALAGLTLATVVNVYGLQVGKWLNNAGAISRWTVTLLLLALGVFAWLRFGAATRIDAASMRPALHIKDIIFWSVIAFAWTGPESMPFMGGEIKNPRRTIPLGLAIAAPAIAVIYIGGTVAVLAALLPHDVNPSSGVMQAIGHVATQLGWVARIPFVAGIDRYLPSAFGRMHPKWGSPVAALVTQSAIAAVFIFLGQGGTSVRGAYDVLVSSTVVITMVPFLFLFASALKLRAERQTRDMVRIPGGKFTVSLAALVGLATTISAIVFAGFPADDDPNKALAVVKVIGLTALMLLSGIAVYLAGRRKALRAQMEYLQ